jgi:hypothetical protein
MDDAAVAGASSQAEYERRRAQHRERVRQRRPLILAITAIGLVAGIAFMDSQPAVGWVLIFAALLGAANALFVAPNHVTAWATGAVGEARTARFLEPLRAEGFAVLHDRRIPGSRANIDHIVIGPPGVFVVETKSFGGQLKVRGNEVYVAGRRKTAMVEEAKREALAVQVALAPELEALGIGVVPVICVHRASLPWFGSSAGGVRIVSGKELVKRLRKADPWLEPNAVAQLANAAADRLRPAGQGAGR